MPPSGNDPFEAFHGFTSPPAFPKEPVEEKGLIWEAKEFNGKLYLPIGQVIELLKQNNVLPKVRAGLERHVQ